MGYSPASAIAPAGDYLLKLLSEKGSVRYGEHFYDGSEELARKLRVEFGMDPDDGWYSVELLADCAAGQLEDAGIVAREFLKEKLADGEPDHRFTLTEKGRAIVASGQQFRYRDMDL